MSDIADRFNPYPLHPAASIIIPVIGSTASLHSLSAIVNAISVRRFMHNTECLVQAEPAHAVFLVEPDQCILHFLRGMILAELFSQFTDAGTDSGVVDLAHPMFCLPHPAIAAIIITVDIIFYQGEFSRLQFLTHGAEVIII